MWFVGIIVIKTKVELQSTLRTKSLHKGISFHIVIKTKNPTNGVVELTPKS